MSHLVMVESERVPVQAEMMAPMFVTTRLCV